MKYTQPIVSIVFASLLGAAVAAQAPPVAPPSQAPMSDRQLQEELLKELRLVRQLLERVLQPQPARPPQPTTAKLTNVKGFVMGRPDAPLTMVEFTDLQCPYCRQFASTTFEQIKTNWIDTGRLRYISRDFPLDFHPQAMTAARASRCAGEQGKFWEVRFTLVKNANLLTPDFINRTVTGQKIDMKAYDACLASKKFDEEILADLQDGTRIGIDGTPSFVLGKTSGSSLEGPMIIGALPYAQFDAKLKELLAGSK